MATEVNVLSRAVDQAGDVLDHVRADRLGVSTPCGDWNLGELIDHLVAAPGHFLKLMRGEDVDWEAEAVPPPRRGGRPRDHAGEPDRREPECRLRTRAACTCGRGAVRAARGVLGSHGLTSGARDRH
ncbi:maleylpyruvate isomerase N-terminal domain-containing protein [Nocardioides pyridinolyticus]